MIRFVNAIEIDRTPGEVFRYLADLRHLPEWNPAIVQVRPLSPGPTGVGSGFQLTRTLPRPGTDVLTVTMFDPDSRIETEGRLGPFRVRITYALERTAEGTRLTNAAELEPPIGLGFIGDLFAERIRGAVDDNLLILKARLEGRRLDRRDRSA